MTKPTHCRSCGAEGTISDAGWHTVDAGVVLGPRPHKEWKSSECKNCGVKYLNELKLERGLIEGVSLRMEELRSHLGPDGTGLLPDRARQKLWPLLVQEGLDVRAPISIMESPGFDGLSLLQ